MELHPNVELGTNAAGRLYDLGGWERLMKLARIGVSLVLLALIGSAVKGQQEIEQRPPQENTGDFREPEKVVWEYFEAYLSFLQYDENQRHAKVKPLKIITNKSLDLNYVTHHYIDSYNKLMQENERTTPPGEVGILNYDPIICAQDFPENMLHASIILIEKNNTNASLKVNLWGLGRKTKPTIVKLIKQKEGWRIDSIECLRYNFDSLYNRIKK